MFITGYAKITYKSGDKYEGNIFKGLRHGDGEFITNIQNFGYENAKESNAYNIRVEDQNVIIGGPWVFDYPKTKSLPAVHLEKSLVKEAVSN